MREPVRIEGEERLEAATGSRSLVGFTDVVALAFHRREGPPPREYGLELVLESSTHRVRLEFEGVRELALGGFGGSPTQVAGLAIHDVSDRQWEGVRYEVGSSEGDGFRFLCRRAGIGRVEALA